MEIEIGSKWIFAGDKTNIGTVIAIGPDGKHVINTPVEGTFVYDNKNQEFGDKESLWKPYESPTIITRYTYVVYDEGKYFLDYNMYNSESAARSDALNIGNWSGNQELVKIISIVFNSDHV